MIMNIVKVHQGQGLKVFSYESALTEGYSDP